MSDSEDTEFYSDLSDDDGSSIKRNIHCFLSKKPVFQKTKKMGTTENLTQLRGKLNKLMKQSSNIKEPRTRHDEKKKAEDLCKTIQNDFRN